jgi:hypothetical protein
MPNPAKPVERKRKSGNPGKRPLPKLSSVTALPAAESVPEPLRDLGAEGSKMWHRIWTAGASWLSVSTDVELVQLLCESMDERMFLRSIVLTGEGEWRDRVALRNIEDQIHRWLSVLGWNPSERGKLGVAEVRSMSALERLQAKAASR